MVVDGDLLVDAVLHQRVHDGAVDLAEELAGVLRLFRNDDEAVVVQHVAVEVVRRARLLAAHAVRALKAENRKPVSAV